MPRAWPGAGSGRPAVAKTVAVAVALPGLATGIASLGPLRSSSAPTNAAMLYLLSVVAATFAGGLPGGLIASVVSFLGLNFFFTPPVRTFAVAKSDDLLALFAFLIIAVLIATLLTKTLAQRARAERREQEALLLYRISSHLLGGAPLPSALDRFAQDAVELFALARCEVTTVGIGGGPELTAAAGVEPAAGARGIALPLRTERGTFGTVVVYAQPPATVDERQLAVARAFAGQVALAVEAAILAEQSRRSQAEAEASRARAALFSSVTHDLRTPLAAIKASATSLLDGGVIFDEAQRTDLLTTIAEESDRLNRLIANLLGLSRLRAGAWVPEKTAAPVEDVIEAAVARLRRRWKGVGLRVHLPPESDTLPPVPMDLLQIDQVVSNLLENAIKYRGDAAPVEVSAGARDGWVEVAVADHGPGIPPEERERVFEEFYRRDTAGGQGGVGLGLAIARAIVGAHGGSMWVADTPGGGATVGFRLPVDMPAVALDAPAPAAVAGPVGQVAS